MDNVITSTETSVNTVRETRAALGMGLFLLALSAAFVALFIIYAILRGSMEAWPPTGMESPPIWIPGINTMVLLASGITMHLAVRSLTRKNRASYGRYLLFTANCGALFLLLQVLFARQTMAMGIVAGDTLYGSLLFALGGFHAVHLLVGVVALALMSLSASIQRVRTSLNRARLWGFYWNFMGVVWLLMFVFLFAI
ncbi:MAG: cytochrome c oxidase subunit 3 [Deltaproteobacteria bacterium]|nr:cytochrome c oxidase subunit 3 [Deltaproteobacteria bacterium]